MKNDKVVKISNNKKYFATISENEVINNGLSILYLANFDCSLCYEIDMNRLRKLVESGLLNYYNLKDGTRIISERKYKRYFSTIRPYKEVKAILEMQ